MNARRMEEKVNAIVDEILDEDQENDFYGTQTCPGNCEKLDDTPKEVSYAQRASLFYSQLFPSKIPFVPAMQMRRGELVEILATRNGGDALAAARRGPVIHVHRRGDRRLHPVALSPRWRSLFSSADRVETGLFSRVSSRRRFVEGQINWMKKCVSHAQNRVCTQYSIQFSVAS